MSKLSDYGLLLMTRFLREANRGKNLSARELAEESHLSKPMVSKVLKALTRAGLLVSHRGANGGYNLAVRPEEVSVADILTAVEGPIAMTECLDEGGDCSQEPVCPVRTNWERINLAVTDVLGSISLQEMAEPLPQPLVTLGNGRRESESSKGQLFVPR